jgi:hypothetical protein
MERHEFLSKLGIGVVAVCAQVAVWHHAVPKAAIQRRWAELCHPQKTAAICLQQTWVAS